MTLQPLPPLMCCGACKRPIPEDCDGRQYTFEWPDGGDGIACRGRWGSDLDPIAKTLLITGGHGITYSVTLELLPVTQREARQA